MYKVILSVALAIAFYMLPTIAAANPTSTSNRVEQTQVKKKPVKKKKVTKKKIQEQKDKNKKAIDDFINDPFKEIKDEILSSFDNKDEIWNEYSKTKWKKKRRFRMPY